MPRPLYILDVFAEEKLAGNPLAVVRHAAGLTTGEMQRFAREMNFSETTFIDSDTPRDGAFDVRIFTPNAEIPFAGHPTLGTAFIIAREILGSASSVTLNLKVGPIPVRFEGAGENPLLWMKQIEPEFGEVLDPATVAHSLGLTPEDFDTRFPIEEVSTGIWFVIAPLRTLDAVKRARVNLDAHERLIAGLKAHAILIFAPETYDSANQLNVRMFAPAFGVPEDPATGSANGCLAGYLAKHRYFGSPKVDIRVEQGMEIARPSRLYLQSADRGGKFGIEVGGRVFLVSRGEWL